MSVQLSGLLIVAGALTPLYTLPTLENGQGV